MKVDLTSYVDGWRRRAKDESAARARAREITLERVAPAAQLLAEEYGARRIILFGSGARGMARADSDIDLAVEGLPPERLVEAVLALERLLGADRVDLVDLSRAGGLLRAKIEQEGIVLHD